MSTPQNKATIFETLKYSGENFFHNKNELEEVIKYSKEICEAGKKELCEFVETSKPDAKSKIDRVSEYIFDSFQLEDVAKIEYEERRECTSEEENMIQEKCSQQSYDDSQIDLVKHALGYKSRYQASVMFKKPCVAVVGQTKAGKSSLINSLLGAVVVPQRTTRQTARVTRITHCDKKFVAFMKEKQVGDNTKQFELQSLKLEESVQNADVDLQNDARRKAENVGIEVRVGSNNQILQNGFDIVDSPGLNENPALNDLCKKMEKSLLPLLIYVIDGKNGLTVTDIDDIKEIRQQTPDIRIIYFVTKLDRSRSDKEKYEREKKKKGYAENEDIPGESDKDVANRRLENVFTKLKIHGFISMNSIMNDCCQFNGASLAAVQKFRINGGTPCSAIDHYNSESFERFELNLLQHLKHKIEEPLKMNIDEMQIALESILEKTRTCASDIDLEKSEKISCLDRFNTGEAELYQRQLNVIEGRLKEAITNMFYQYKRNIKNECQNSQKLRDRYDVLEFIERTLKQQMEDFISNFLLETDELLITELKHLMKKLSEGEFGRTAFEKLLEHRLYHAYDLAEDSFFAGNHLVKKTKINKIITSIQKKIQKLRFGSHGVSRNHEDEAESCLSEIERDNFFNNVYSSVKVQIDKSHQKFTSEMQTEENFLQCDLDFGVEIEKKWQTISERLATLYMKTYIVNTNLSLVLHPNREPELLGEGRQAKLTKVHQIYPEQVIVKKTYKNVFKDFNSSGRARSLGLEVYTTRSIKHRRFLSLLGIKIEQTDGGLKFSSFYPYMPEGSLKEFLENKPGIDLKTRMKLAIDIAEGLQHLHSLKIIHRDITPNNILVKKCQNGESDSRRIPYEAVISDFGVLSSLGFASKEQVGTGFYCPSESYVATELRRNGYSFASDVFSFGMSLWQLLTYKLFPDPEYSNFDPEFVINCNYDKEKVGEMILKGERPEYRNIKNAIDKPPEQKDKIETLVYEFLNRCWSEDKHERPSFLKPDQDIRLSQKYQFTDLTISELLQKFYDMMF